MKIKVGLKKLNVPQREAVLYDGASSLMVVAGAGAGKTKTLTSRIAYLIKKGTMPSRMFVTTFTVKASEEMTERLHGIVGKKVDSLKIGTSHSLFLKLYKDWHDWSGVEDEYPKLIMGGGQWMTIVGIINKYQVDKKHNKLSSRDVKGYLTAISWAKNQGERVEDMATRIDVKNKKLHITGQGDKEKYSYEYSHYLVYKNYEAALRKNNKMDFDDFLIKTYYALLGSPEFVIKLKRRLQYIFIDEAQDLNKIQYMLFDLISDGGNMTCVLDDWQVIYGFRGASVDYIKEFLDKYKPQIVKLEQNYRSTKVIVGHGNNLIKHNKNQLPKTLFTENVQGDKATVLVNNSVEEEADAILNQIEDLLYEGHNLKDIAILYRTNAQSRALVDTLIVNKIPHKVYSKEGFYDRREVKDVLAYVRICCNPFEADMDDFRRIINRPARFIGKQFLDAIEDYQLENNVDNFWSALKNWQAIGLHYNQASNMMNFINVVNGLYTRVSNGHITTADLINAILNQTGYLDWLNAETEDDTEEPDNDNMMNVDALLAGAHRFSDPDEYLIFVQSIQDGEDDMEDEDYVHLMTVHKSKGLEFNAVIVAGMSDKIMPHYKAENLEDERRIAYVAISRAKKRLIISALHGKFGRMNVEPSMFIREMKADIPMYNFVKDKGVSLVPKTASVPVHTVYDTKGRVIAVKKVNTLIDADELSHHIDNTIGRKHNLIDVNGEVIDDSDEAHWAREAEEQ